MKLFYYFKVIMWNIIKLKNPAWYIDATGDVHQKINGQKEIFIYRTVCHDENKKKSFQYQSININL